MTDLDFDHPRGPNWKPSFYQPIDEVVDRLRYYTGSKEDFAVFQNGTCVILEPNLSSRGAEAAARKILTEIIHFHPDMEPLAMDDGNVLVTYNRPAYNVVLERCMRANWAEIDSHHLGGLIADEVLITPAGPNKFDDIGIKGLVGRCYMFMDAQAPKIIRLERATTSG